MSKIPVFYRPEQNAPQQGTSPSPQKPEYVVRSWQARGFPLELRSFLPATREELCLVHAPEYVLGVLEGDLPNGFGTFSEQVAEALPYTTGSFVAAALHAWQTKGVAASPTSGFHHAIYARGGGFCTFNGLMVAASRLVRAGAQKVAILDLDAHDGNGTRDILGRLPSLARHVLHYTYGGDGGTELDGASLAGMLDGLLARWKAQGVEVVLYQAGADPHVDDPLGGHLTTEDMRLRDRTVFQVCARLGLPLAWNLAGGYQQLPGLKPEVDFDAATRPVLDLHDNTFRECANAWLPTGGRA
ncbi:MAG: histone deacetylase [Deltaproteobacteria bacterium]|nr:histone deacetylase [Deltaproteobacteria bacterium]